MRSYCTVFFYCSDPNIESGEWVHVRDKTNPARIDFSCAKLGIVFRLSANPVIYPICGRDSIFVCCSCYGPFRLRLIHASLIYIAFQYDIGFV